ncbi:hypothetical protein DRQ00_07135 [candidate division KSB1 bacterium]|nr:MAG: hypothetical protein DRQ00_07135 [candidate division KSB1 bacterium]
MVRTVGEKKGARFLENFLRNFLDINLNYLYFLQNVKSITNRVFKIMKKQGIKQIVSKRHMPASKSLYSARKIPPKLYRIGEIVQYSGLSRQTIHNYTTMGLITEVCRSSGGHRLYDETVFARLDLIEQLKRRNKSMREIRKYFDEMDKGR